MTCVKSPNKIVITNIRSCIAVVDPGISKRGRGAVEFLESGNSFYYPSHVSSIFLVRVVANEIHIVNIAC